MEKVIFDVLDGCIKKTGKIIGLSLAVRLVSDNAERVRAMNTKEIKKLIISEKQISIKLYPKTSNKKSFEILNEIVSCIINSYSKIIGIVAKTLVKETIDNVKKKYGSKYPGLDKISIKV